MLHHQTQTVSFTDFTLNTRYEDIPDVVIQRVQDLILDLIGVSAAAHEITASRIGREIAIQQFNTETQNNRARILFDGRSASLAGAAYAGANQIDSLDAHDGFSLAKGHAGCGLLPAVLAFAERLPQMSGREFLTTMVLGYEIASRAGIALHGTAPDYHTSGAWVCVAVAALGARLNSADANTLAHAIGIAEYHGPRSQMMREIDNPTMLHDGSGWGSMVGVTSAELALSGFEGAPAITIKGDDVTDYWADLGKDWLTCNQNIKLFPICRWAHAPIQAALNVRAQNAITADDIAAIEIFAFHEATRLAQGIPETTGKAQYSISYPVAAALAFGQVAAREVSGETFNDPDIARLISVTTVAECDHCNENFPADRLGRTVITTKDGRKLDSDITRAPGEHTQPIERAGIIGKFKALTASSLSPEQASNIEREVFALDQPDAKLSNLTALLYPKIS